MTGAYYNEFDPHAAAWLRELIKLGLIADGEVDSRSIVDVRADDLRGFAQCHFFAGIGGWSYALRLAGWPDDRPVWTGSCPCPPFSAAGKGSECPGCGGKSCLSHPLVTAGWVCLDCGDEWRGDDRHLLPEFLRLIGECRPATVFGEQVASRDGRLWLYALRGTVERVGYALGAADLCAAGVGAPHIRQRLFFVAKRLANTGGERREWHPIFGRETELRPKHDERDCGLADADGRDASAERLQRGWQHGQQPQDGGAGGLADADSAGSQSREWDGAGVGHGYPPAAASSNDRPGPTDGLWGSADWLFCRDGGWRPVEPAVFGMVDGIPGVVVPRGSVVPAAFPLAQKQERRVMRLRGYGNAIVPQVAAAFIEAAS